jgi:hypothetical protein
MDDICKQRDVVIKVLRLCLSHTQDNTLVIMFWPGFSVSTATSVAKRKLRPTYVPAPCKSPPNLNYSGLPA